MDDPYIQITCTCKFLVDKLHRKFYSDFFMDDPSVCLCLYRRWIIKQTVFLLPMFVSFSILLDDDKVETTTATTEPPNATTTQKTYKKWGNINWFEATTTSKPRYVKPKYDNSGYDKTNSWGKKHFLDDQDLDKLSTTHRSYNRKTADTKKANPWHIDESVPKKTKTKNYDSRKYGTYDHTQKADTFKIPTKKTTPADEEEDFPRRVFVDNNPDFPDEPHNHNSEPETKETIMRTTKSPNLRITKGEL